MSWDATLFTEGGHCILDQNFTHNTNGMIIAVLDAVGYDRGVQRYSQIFTSGAWQYDVDLPRSWWAVLDGMSAPDSVKFLDVIIGGLMEAPALFRSMNPKNGWGDYDSLLAVLVKMRDAAATEPHAHWWAGG